MPTHLTCSDFGQSTVQMQNLESSRSHASFDIIKKLLNGRYSAELEIQSPEGSEPASKLTVEFVGANIRISKKQGAYRARWELKFPSRELVPLDSMVRTRATSGPLRSSYLPARKQVSVEDGIRALKDIADSGAACQPLPKEMPIKGEIRAIPSS